jgi:phosphatidylglycerophosphate synthase
VRSAERVLTPRSNYAKMISAQTWQDVWPFPNVGTAARVARFSANAPISVGRTVDADMTEGAQDRFVLSDWFRARGNAVISPIVGAIAGFGIRPNHLTLLGSLLSLPAAWMLALGRQQLAGLFLLLSSACDALDGSLARHSDRVTLFGGFLDSVLDRVSESIVYLGLVLYALDTQDLALVMVTFVAIVSSILVSYVRARAEGQGIECRVGLFTRFERLCVMVLGLLIRRVDLAAWAVSILASFTVAQRVAYVYRVTRRGEV